MEMKTEKTREKKKLNWKKIINRGSYSIQFVFGFVLIIYGLSMFYSGWHNVDLYVNDFKILGIFNKTTDNYKDRYGLGEYEYLDLNDVYILGMSQMRISIYIVLIGTLFFVGSLSTMRYKT